MYRDQENGSIGGGSGSSGSGNNHHLPHHSQLFSNHHSQQNNLSHHQPYYHNNGKPLSSGASNGAGPLPVLPAHKSHPRLIEPSLSRWTANPVSLPPRISPSTAMAASLTSSPFSSAATASGISERGILGPSRIPSQVPTVPQRNNNCVSDNWVDLEELYRWLQELEDTKIEEISDEDHSFGKRRFSKKNKRVTNVHSHSLYFYVLVGW